MKNIITLFIFLATTILNAQTFELSGGNQIITWQGKAAVGGYAPEGTLEVTNALLKIEDDQITQLEILVDMKSLDQEIEQLRKHLREKDFFYVNKFPEATFKLTKEVEVQSEKVELEGKFTIRGIENEEMVTAILTKNESEVIINFQTKMNRTAYGIKYNSPSFFKRLKENAIDDYFTIKGEIVLQQINN
ncbi:MAG: YceI family protein [Flavobacteriaceae bacterium]|nr:YceI family protein [Flavobacteriaceae bacterium]